MISVSFPDSAIFLKSRIRCAQHNWRCSTSTQLYPDQRSEISVPLNSSPSSSLAIDPLRLGRIKNTVASPSNPTQSQDFSFDSLQLVSSACTAAWLLTCSSASSWGSLRAALVCPSKFETAPSDIVTPKKSDRSCYTLRRDTRYAPESTATVACNRGPKAPKGRPSANFARVASPQAEHISSWS